MCRLAGQLRLIAALARRGQARRARAVCVTGTRNAPDENHCSGGCRCTHIYAGNTFCKNIIVVINGLAQYCGQLTKRKKSYCMVTILEVVYRVLF
jgi:hypothetical protein